ncbi:MAG: hydroxyisourate hydrolase [Bacteroidota bacterium]
MKSPITTHVLDTTRGTPAQGVTVSLEFQPSANKWEKIGSGTTNSDGRISDLLPDSHILQPGIYRITFETGKYFLSNKVASFYPYVQIVFKISDTTNHYHVPLLLNPYGYSTYRGS